MNEMYELGKYAALEDLIDIANAGASFSDALELIDETINAPLDKYASYEDDEYRLGVDAACYAFLKEAHAMFGQYDVSDSYDIDMFEHVLEKIAEDEAEAEELTRGQRARNFAAKHKKKLIAGGAAAAGVPLAYWQRERLGAIPGKVKARFSKEK